MRAIHLAVVFVILSLSGVVPVIGKHDEDDSKINITEAPFTVSVEYRNVPSCVGFLITRSFVATTAYYATSQLNETKVRVGSANRKNGGHLFDVKSSKRHESYNQRNKAFDIGLLELSQAVDGTLAKPIPLANQPASQGQTLSVISWGDFNSEGPTADLLRRAYVKVVGINKCRKAYNELVVPKKIFDHNFCAVPKIEGRGPCYGDRGAPAVVNDAVVGLYSGAHGCGQKKFPGVYVDIYAFLPWIRKNVPDLDALQF